MREPIDSEAEEALIRLLLDLYRLRMSDLEWTLQRVTDTQSVRENVPPPEQVAPRVFARSVVAFLWQAGLLNQRFFDALLADRPRREADIRSVQRRFTRMVLVLMAGETEGPPLDTKREADAILAAIRASFGDSLWNVKVVQDTRRDEWVKEVALVQPRVLHFGGHGTVESWLVDVDGVVPHDPLMRLVSQASGLELLVLNACTSANAAKAAAASGVPWAIGMRDPIKDEVAISFAAALYASLARGEGIGDAFCRACEARDWDDLAADAKPQLHRGTPK